MCRREMSTRKTQVSFPRMARLLIVHHTPSPPMRALLEAALAGTREPELAGVEVITRPALTTGAADVLAADGYLLATPANFGYMSGALKHAFDTFYYPVLGETTGRPFGFWVHGNDDTAGAVRAISAITSGLGWTPAAAPLSLTGAPDRAALAAVRDLASTVTVALLDAPS
jgi:NADPH-dependent FMN reductase